MSDRWSGDLGDFSPQNCGTHDEARTAAFTFADAQRSAGCEVTVSENGKEYALSVWVRRAGAEGQKRFTYTK